MIVSFSRALRSSCTCACSEAPRRCTSCGPEMNFFSARSKGKAKQDRSYDSDVWDFFSDGCTHPL